MCDFREHCISNTQLYVVTVFKAVRVHTSSRWRIYNSTLPTALESWHKATSTEESLNQPTITRKISTEEPLVSSTSFFFFLSTTTTQAKYAHLLYDTNPYRETPETTIDYNRLYTTCSCTTHPDDCVKTFELLSQRNSLPQLNCM